MRRWIYFLGMKWFSLADILALALGQGLQSLLLFLFGASIGYYVVLPQAMAAAANPGAANPLRFVPPFAFRLIPWAVGVSMACVPWFLAIYGLQNRHPARPKNGPPPT
jgi:hypothetical protein